MNQGWIKLHRKSLDHWLYKENRPHTKREAWEDMLLLCNHSEEKILIGTQIIDCKRGQSVKSLKTWADSFNWTISKVRRFFILLKKENMIELESVQKSTRLTVCNYEYYQSERNNNETIMKRKRNDNETQTATNKNDKNVKKGKNNINIPKFNFRQSLIDLGVNPNIADDWLIVRKAKKASNTETAFRNIKKEIELSVLPANECIKMAAEKSWQGFKAEWISKTSNSPTNYSKDKFKEIFKS